MSDEISYYKLEKVTIENRPGGIATAAVRSCGLCGTMISGMGGPGSGSVCIPCGNLVKSGQARSCIDWSQAENTEPT